MKLQKLTYTPLKLSIPYVFARHFCSNIEVDVISKQTIKPSSPTPQHLRSFRFSIFDQFVAHLLYTRFILFYPMSNSHCRIEEKLTNLKRSLSTTLTHFYPLAGRIKDQSSIDCNDEGASYVEAHVSCQMSYFLTQPKLELLDMFLPCEPISKDPPELTVQVAVKANIFQCGGVAIGVCLLHKVMGVSGFADFLKAWAATARGETKEVYAHNMVASLFPPNKQVLSYDSSWMASAPVSERGSCLRRFVFDAVAIATLKEKVKSDLVPNPSTHEVVCGLLWKSALNASGNFLKPSVILNSVNLLPRMKSPLPDYVIGNLVWLAAACYNPGSKADMELRHFVGLLRRSTENLNGDFVEKIQGEEGYGEFCNALDEVKNVCSKIEKSEFYAVSSLGKMGLYEVDFGWGKPVWVTSGGAAYKVLTNAFVLFEGRSGHGMEAWLLLNEPQMNVLERDPNFLSYAILNPSIQCFV